MSLPPFEQIATLDWSNDSISDADIEELFGDKDKKLLNSINKEYLSKEISDNVDNELESEFVKILEAHIWENAEIKDWYNKHLKEIILEMLRNRLAIRKPICMHNYAKYK